MAQSTFVPAGGNLQAAFDQAKGGDIISLEAGATFTGNFRLPVNHSGQRIKIQSAGIEWTLPKGKRVSKDQARWMAKLVSPNAGPTLTIPSEASHYLIYGIEFTTGEGVYCNDLIAAGETSETDINKVAKDLIFDRVYVHAQLPTGSKRGLALNSGAASVINSYFENFVSDWQDTQAICGWNGPGPFLIENNFLQSGSEIVAFGGAPPAIHGLIPSDITIRRNTFFKPSYWWDGDPQHTGPHVRAKNHLEFKNGQRVLVEQNTFSNNMIGADQLGCTILLNVRDEERKAPWATVSNITVRNNYFDNCAGGILFMGHDGDGGGTAKHMLVSNNTFTNLGAMGGDGRLFQFISAVEDVQIDHNTAFPTGWLAVFSGDACGKVNFTNNIVTAGWSFAGDYATRGQETMDRFNPDGVFRNNIVIQGYQPHFTGKNFQNNTFAGSLDEVGFADPAQGNFQLNGGSAFHGAATDGKDIGSLQK